MEMKEAFGNAGVLKAKTKAKQVSLAPNDVRIPTLRSIKETTAVAEKRQYIADIPAHIRGLVNRIRHIQMVSLEEQAIRSGEFKALEDEVLAHLDSEEKLLADAARQAYAMAMVETLPADKRLVKETIKGNSDSRLPGLIGLKILELGDNKNAVTVEVYHDVYVVNGGREFAIKLAKGLAEGVARAIEAAYKFHKEEKERVEGFKAQANISIAKLLGKEPGRAFMNISDARDGNRPLLGGALLAESNGEVVKVSQFTGHFRGIMSKITKAGAIVPVESLSREQLRFDKRPPDEEFQLCRILHAILRRGIAEAQKEEECKPQLQK